MFRSFIAAAVVSMAFAAPAVADKLSLNEISTYLNGIQSGQGSFTQINGDGTISTGTISIKRPGKVRFDYNPPEKALVVATAGAVFILDRRLGAQPETYPLSQTPLSIILARNVNLGAAGMVKSHTFDGTATVVTAQDPKRPEFGAIQLKFTGNPVELRQWVILDGEGGSTTVVLGALDRTGLPNSLFSIEDELKKLN